MDPLMLLLVPLLSSITNLADPSTKLQMLQVTHRKNDALPSPPQGSAGLTEPSSEEGGG